jgi:predicted kinase
MLIGVPGSGKSTWIGAQDWARDCVLVSTDKLIDIEAGRQGKTYNEVFKDYIWCGSPCSYQLSELWFT